MASPTMQQNLIEIEDQWGAHNYHPLDIVVERASGVWVYDTDGKRYMDCLSAYSALNQGHVPSAHSRRMMEQAERVTLDLARVPQRSAAAVLPGTRRAVPDGHGPADEHRRGGGGDRHQGRAPLGLHGEGHSADQAEIIVCAKQFPRAHHDDHRLLFRARLSKTASVRSRPASR